MRFFAAFFPFLTGLIMLIAACSREQRGIDNKFKEAIKLYKQGKIYDAQRKLQSVEALLPELEPEKKIAIEYRLANTYYQLGYLDEAYLHYKEYASSLRKLPIRDTQEAIIRLVEVAEVLSETGKFAQSYSILQVAKELWNKLSQSNKNDTEDSIAFFQLQEGFAFYYLKTFNYPKADSLYSYLIPTYGRQLSYVSSKKYVTFLLRAADAFLSVGKPSLADSAINTALKELENKISKNAFDEAEVINMLSRIYEEKGELQKAIQASQKAMTIYANKVGKEHPLYISAHYNYVWLIGMGMLNDIDTSIAEVKKGLVLSKKVFGDTSVYTSRYYNILGLLYADKVLFDSSYNDSAIIALQNALKRIILIIGEESFPVAVIYNNISNVYKDFDKKFEFSKKALEISQKILPAYHPFNLLAMGNLAQIAAMTNSTDLADSLYNIVFEHSDNLNPVHILQFKFNYGAYKYYEREYDTAIKTLLDVIEAYESNTSLQGLTLVYSASLTYLGLAYLEQNMIEIAKPYLIKADSILSVLYDKVESPQIRNMHKNVKIALKYIEENS